MDRVISGEDPAQIPPLTVSSLDHQIREGMLLHVLPLLLRRPDIHVEVKTRAHRATTYDIAVSVKSNNRASASATRTMRQMESTPPDVASTTHSVSGSATTAHAQNGFGGDGDLYEFGGSAYSSFMPQKSIDGEKQQQQQLGLMGALGGAIGGLLSRRKPTSPSYFDAGNAAVNNSYDMGSAVGAAGPGPMDFPPPYTPEPQGGVTDISEPHHDSDEPYHRLVSAPPGKYSYIQCLFLVQLAPLSLTCFHASFPVGKIGVSFVEYRGHAMVSDVSEESPLLGW